MHAHDGAEEKLRISLIPLDFVEDSPGLVSCKGWPRYLPWDALCACRHALCWPRASFAGVARRRQSGKKERCWCGSRFRFRIPAVVSPRVRIT